MGARFSGLILGFDQLGFAEVLDPLRAVFQLFEVQLDVLPALRGMRRFAFRDLLFYAKPRGGGAEPGAFLGIDTNV